MWQVSKNETERHSHLLTVEPCTHLYSTGDGKAVCRLFVTGFLQVKKTFIHTLIWVEEGYKTLGTYRKDSIRSHHGNCLSCLSAVPYRFTTSGAENPLENSVHSHGCFMSLILRECTEELCKLEGQLLAS